MPSTQAQNGPNRLRSYFTDTGVRVTPLDPETASWGAMDLFLGGYAWKGQIATLMGGDVTVEGSRLNYSFPNESFTGWYANTERGLEQGFTLTAPPLGRPKAEGSPIQLSFGLSGDLRHNVLVNEDRTTAYFQSAQGHTLSYAIESVTGASGQHLTAHLDVLTDSEGLPNGIRMVIQAPGDDDYPLHFQALVQADETGDKNTQEFLKLQPQSLQIGQPPVGGRPEVAPANDTCAGAEAIPAGGPFPYLTAVTADITDATTVGDPPVPSCEASVQRSIWYRFTPTATASYTISTCADAPTGSTVDDTVLAIYTSSTSACGGTYTQLAGALGCDDDTCTNENAHAVIGNTTLTAGTTYFILAHQWGGAPAPTAGNTAVQLRISVSVPPANDTCAGAVALSLDIPVNGTNALAANDYAIGTPSPTCFTGVGQTTSSAVGRDTVYSYTPSSTGSYSFRAILRSAAGGGDLVLWTSPSCPAAPPSVTKKL